MPNPTFDEIEEAIAAVIESADGQGIVITDRRFAKANTELSRLLKSQSDEDEWKGWIITMLSIPQQIDETGTLCRVVSTYRFALKFFHFYDNELDTDGSFRAAVFAANEALNADQFLSISSGLVKHSTLQSLEDFDIDNIGGGTVDQLCHTAPFILDVVVENQY